MNVENSDKESPVRVPSTRGRIAPTPTGHFHLGHARTFFWAWRLAREAGGAVVFRNEDLDADRCKAEYVAAMYEDLRWLGLDWDEGPDVGGPFAPYEQSMRTDWYLEAWRRLAATGFLYPSPHSRRDVREALGAPQEGVGEAVFPKKLRPPVGPGTDATHPGDVNWRFRVPDGRVIEVLDEIVGRKSYVAGEDFGDFLVWRKDGFPSYELAVVADDHAMGINQVVRGEDLLLSTSRQLLLYEALGWPPPMFHHCPLVRDNAGRRLAKRHRDLSLRKLRERGERPEEILRLCAGPPAALLGYLDKSQG